MHTLLWYNDIVRIQAKTAWVLFLIPPLLERSGQPLDLARSEYGAAGARSLFILFQLQKAVQLGLAPLHHKHQGGDGVALLKACPRCWQLIPHGQPYCEACAPIAEAERKAKQERRAEYLNRKYNQRYNAKRAQDDPKYRQFRNSKPWKMTSRAKLQACGYKCEAKLEGCQHIACEVHHIKPLKTPEGWEQRLDWANLQGVCVVCHNILDGKNGRRKADPNVLDMREIMKKL